jgi:hypothetical protein
MPGKSKPLICDIWLDPTRSLPSRPIHSESGVPPLNEQIKLHGAECSCGPPSSPWDPIDP